MNGQRGLASAWLIAEAIVIYRAIHRGGPPLPSALLAVSGLFVMLGIVADAGAPQVAIALGVGVDAAAILQLWPIAPAPTPAAKGAPAPTTPSTAPAPQTGAMAPVLQTNLKAPV